MARKPQRPPTAKGRASNARGGFLRAWPWLVGLLVLVLAMLLQSYLRPGGVPPSPRGTAGRTARPPLRPDESAACDEDAHEHEMCLAWHKGEIHEPRPPHNRGYSLCGHTTHVPTHRPNSSQCVRPQPGCVARRALPSTLMERECRSGRHAPALAAAALRSVGATHRPAGKTAVVETTPLLRCQLAV